MQSNDDAAIQPIVHLFPGCGDASPRGVQRATCVSDGPPLPVCLPVLLFTDPDTQHQPPRALSAWNVAQIIQIMC